MSTDFVFDQIPDHQVYQLLETQSLPSRVSGRQDYFMGELYFRLSMEQLYHRPEIHQLFITFPVVILSSSSLPYTFQPASLRTGLFKKFAGITTAYWASPV